MEQHTVLIADSSDEFCNELQSILQWICNVRTCSTGSKVLSMISDLHPDILLLDLMLPELDGISVLKALSATGTPPVILATTCLVSDYILHQAQCLNVNYLLVKPCDVRSTAARIQEQLHLLTFPGIEDGDMEFRIAGLLLMMGFSVKLHGFKYLREAIAQMLRNPDQSITKELYPGVASVFDTAGSHVERSIRGAIQDAWRRRDDRIWQLYFPPDGQGCESKPTNAGFITRIADGLRISSNSAAENRLEFIPSPEKSDFLLQKMH